MTDRTYRLQCPIARALDALGDRWSLLILRDLHAGPAGFQVLQDGLGLASNLLAARLSDLARAQIIVQPKPRGPYQLTELGVSTAPVLWSLAGFAASLPELSEPREPGNVRSLVVGLRTTLQGAESAPALRARLDFGDEHIDIDTTGPTPTVTYGEDNRPFDLIVETTYSEFLALHRSAQDTARSHDSPAVTTQGQTSPLVQLFAGITSPPPATD